MEFKAALKYIRITPRKVSMIADEVRGKSVAEALRYLQFSPRKRTAGMVSKVIRSAVANADQKGTVDVDQLVIKTLLIGKAPTLKRFKSRAKGSASPVLKRSSHIFVTVSEK